MATSDRQADQCAGCDVPERINDLGVEQVGYREHDGGVRVARVDLIDRRLLRTLASLSPEDAVALADRLCEVAVWTAAGIDRPRA